VLLAAMGLSLASAQNTTAASSPKQTEPAKYDAEVVVTDKQGAVIPNANVSLVDPGNERKINSNITDSMGRAHLLSLLAGNYMVEVSASRFQTAREFIDVPSQSEISVTLFIDPDPGLIGYQGPGPFPPGIDVITSTLEDQLPLPPIPSPAAAQEPAPVPRRNPVARFFSAIGHKLGF